MTCAMCGSSGELGVKHLLREVISTKCRAKDRHKARAVHPESQTAYTVTAFELDHWKQASDFRLHEYKFGFLQHGCLDSLTV